MTLKDVLVEAAWFALLVPPALAAVWLMANFLPLEVFALVIGICGIGTMAGAWWLWREMGREQRGGG